MAISGRGKGLCRGLRVVFAFGEFLAFGAQTGSVQGDVSQAGQKLEKVSLQLKWVHSFQFAGYYAAKHKGYYREAGLDVDLRSLAEGDCPIDSVLQGRATYGIGSPDLLLYYAQGVPVVALAAIFQHSPVAILTLKASGLDSLSKLRGKRFMSTRKDFHFVLDYMFQQAGLGMEDIECVPHTRDIQDLIEGRVDAMSAYRITQPFQLDRLSVEYNVLYPQDYGMDIYNDCLFTLENELRRHPERVRQFREAGLRGWEYALDHPGEIIDLILSEYDDSLNREKLEFQSRKIRELIAPEMVKVGYMHAQRWRKMAGQMADLGLLEPEQVDNLSLSRFLYDPRSNPGRKQLFRELLAGVLGLSLISGGFLMFNLCLQKKVKQRTVDLETSETNFLSLVQGAWDGVVVIDKEGEVLFANDRFLQLTGENSEPGGREASGKDPSPGWRLQDYIRLSDYESLLQRAGKLEDARPTDRFQEMQLKRKNAKTLCIEARASEIQWKRKPATMVQLHDCSWRKRLQKDILDAVTQEKQNLSLDLHDGVSQNMAAAAYLSRFLGSKASGEAGSMEKNVAEIQELLQKCLCQVRDLAYGLKNGDVMDTEIEKTLRRMAQRSQRIFKVQCEVTGCGTPLTVKDGKGAGHIYFIVQEAISNAVRHGQARNIRIILESFAETEFLKRITITDDGEGFDVDTKPQEGMGLGIMRYRADMIHAEVCVDSARGRGSTVICELQNPD